jgi:hypothetical protein
VATIFISGWNKATQTIFVALGKPLPKTAEGCAAAPPPNHIAPSTNWISAKL